MKRHALAVLALCAALGAPAPARAEGPPLPAALWGDDGVATTDDARAFRVNPAAIGQRYPSEWWLAYSHSTTNQEAYSAFQSTALDRHLRALDIRRLFIGGLATDYCVLNTVTDALAMGYAVCLLMDGIKAVNLQPDDGRRAEQEMLRLGATPVQLETFAE